MRRQVCPEGQIDIFSKDVMAQLYGHAAPEPPLPPLPFPQNKAVDVPRVTKIFATNSSTVLLMLKQEMLDAYKVREGKAVAWRIKYESVVAYGDQLRLKYHLPRRIAKKGSMRIPDADVLPFPMAEAMTVAEVAEHLDVRPQLVGHMLEEGDILGYRLIDGSPWRISRKSFRIYLEKLREQVKTPLASSAP